MKRKVLRGNKTKKGETRRGEQVWEGPRSRNETSGLGAGVKPRGTNDT